MRIPAHIEKEIRRELAVRQPDKHGLACALAYDKAVAAWNHNMNNKQDYNQRLMAAVDNAGRRLRAWHDSLLKARTEFVEREKDAGEP